MINTPRRQIIAAVILTVFFSLSCSLPVGISSKIRETLENKISTPQAVLPTTEKTVESATAAFEGTPGDLITTISGIDTSMLDSYRATFSVTSAGIDESGANITLSMQMESEVDHIQLIRHKKFLFEGTGAAARTGNVEIYQQKEQSYVYYAGDTNPSCLSIGTAGDLLSSPPLSPEDFIQSIQTGYLLETNVMINDIAVDHYQVKSMSLDLADVNFESGEVWVARDGGYIVRCTGLAKGDISDGTHQGSGTIEWDYNLYDVNRVPEIVIPEACLQQQESMDDIPVPDNAVNLTSLGGIITFESPDQPKKVSTFYRPELPALGWILMEESNTGGVLILSFEKGNQGLQIMITPKSGTGTSVIITSIALR